MAATKQTKDLKATVKKDASDDVSDSDKEAAALGKSKSQMIK